MWEMGGGGEGKGERGYRDSFKKYSKFESLK